MAFETSTSRSPGRTCPRKRHVFHAPETDEAFLDQPDVSAQEAAKLRRCLAHQHAGQERVIRHVAAHPEFIVPDVLVADDDFVLGVDEDDRGELHHLETLRIVPRDPLTIDQNVRRVNGCGVDQRHWRHARGSFLYRSTAILTCTTMFDKWLCLYNGHVWNYIRRDRSFLTHLKGIVCRNVPWAP